MNQAKKNRMLALLLSVLLAIVSPTGVLAEATASEPITQEDEDGVIENEDVLLPEETMPPEEIASPDESGDMPEKDGVLPQESEQEELDSGILPDEESSEFPPDDDGFVWDEAHPLKSAVEIFGSIYALTVVETPVYSTADMSDTIFTVFSDCVLLATGYDEEQGVVEVWFIAESGETLNGYVYEDALSQTVMTYEDAQTTSDELQSFSVPTDAGELPVFVVAGTKPEDSITQPDEQGDSVTDEANGNLSQDDAPEETPSPELAVIPDSSETPVDTATQFVPVATPDEVLPAPTATPSLDDESALPRSDEEPLNDYGIMPINAPYPSGAYLGASVQVTTNKKYHNTVPDIVLLGDDEQNCDIHKTSDGGYVYCLENNKDSPGNESSGEYESYEVMDWLTYSQRATGHHSLWSASTWHALAAVAHKGYHHGTVITGTSKQSEGNTATAKDLYNFGGTQIAMRCVTNELEGDGSTRGWDIDNISSNYRNGGPSNADEDIGSLYTDALTYVRDFLYEGNYSYNFDIKVNGRVVSGPTRRSDGNYDVTISLTPSHSYQYDYGISADHVVSLNGRSYADEDNWYHVNSTSSTGATQVNLVLNAMPCTINFGTLGSSSYEDGFFIGVPRDNHDAQAVMILSRSGPMVIGGAGSMKLDMPKGSIQVTKQSTGGTLLPGAVFELLGSSGGVLQTQSTGSNGITIFSNLDPGSYTIREKNAPEGYRVAVPDSQGATVTVGQTSNVVFKNDEKEVRIKIIKTDQVTKAPLAGVQFTITRLSGPAGYTGGPEIVATLTTGPDGTAESDWLGYGRYRIEEIAVPAHYVDRHFSQEIDAFEDGKTYSVTVENEPTKGFIKLTKTDRHDQTPIEGVQFDIFDSNGEQVGSMTTGADGVATSEPLTKGKYTVKEHADPEGYVAELITQDAVVKSDETTTLHADNQPIQGKIRIIKKDQLTKEALAGAEFTITRISGLPSHKGAGDGETVAVVTTGVDGVAESPLLTYGKYRVTETKVPEHFVDNAFSTEVFIKDDNMQTYEIEVENEPTKGWLRLTKRDRQNGNPIEGVQFDIYYNDQYGEGLAGTMTTGTDGVATSEPLRKGKYLVREHGTTPGYLFEEIELEASVRSDEITELEATNRHVTVKLYLLKRDVDEYAGDSGNTSTRGDGVLTGAEFQVLAGADIEDWQGNVIYSQGEVVIPSLKTVGDAASVTTDELWPGLYEIVELSPPTGYQPSDEHIFIDARDAANQSVEAIITYEGIKANEIKMGAKALIKTLGDDSGKLGEGRIETPEPGAEFDVYLKRAGSYESAREFERDHLVTDANGYAMTKPLPYGIYTLRQTKGEAGYEIKAPIDFFIDGSESLINPPVMSLSDRPILYRIKLVKQDAKTGNTVPLAGASFKLRDGNGEYVMQTVFYPREQRIDTFTTDESGSVTLPETVRWGAYSIEEIHAPEGYLLPDAELSIFVGRDGDTPDEVYELEYTVQDAPVKGRLVLEKKGKQLTGFEEVKDAYGNTLYRPVFEDGYLAGATFELRAAEDIRGGDGTLWFSASELADTLITTADGPVESKELPLGRYTLTEVSAPEGYAPAEAPQEIELAYADDQTPLVEVQMTVRNEYIPIEVNLEKVAETLETFADGNTVHETVSRVPGEGFVFGLFADQDFQCGDGILYADSLVATGATGADGTLAFSGHYPHGRYYVKELSAPDGWEVNPEKFPVSLIPDLANEDGVIRAALPEPVFDALVYSRVTLTKEDITGEHTLPDTMIELRDESDRVVWRDYTDENGNLPDIPVVPGTYTFREVWAPDGYELSVAEMTFTVDKFGSVTGDTVVRDDYTRFFLLKQDESGEPLAGVEFGLFKEDGLLLMTAETDEDGLATFEKIPYGDYTIVETKPLPGYLKSGTQIHLSVNGRFINPSEPVAVVTNEKLRMRGKKVDTSGNPLAGAEFALIDAQGYVIQSAVSDTNGEFVFEGIPYGDWVIRETEAPDGFSRMDDRLLHVDDSWTEPEQTYTFVDIPDHYEFVKVDGPNDPLPGVKFALEDAEGTVLRELVSDEDGIVHVTGLTPGTYTIRETEALEGYTPTDETIDLTIDERYVAPEKLKRIKNYSDIQTGVDFPITPLTVAGAGMVLASVLLTVAYQIETREKRRHSRRKKKSAFKR